jgi:hypothetical protein
MRNAAARPLRAEEEHEETPRRRRLEAAPHPGRRTVTITGRPGPLARVPRVVEVKRRRPPRTAQERVAGRPDRVALWALMLALFLVLVTIVSSHGA